LHSKPFFKTRTLLPALALLGLLTACDDLGDEVIDPLADFRGYRDWPVLSTDHLDPAVLATAHMAGDDRFIRVVYGDVSRTGNTIHAGSVIVKETFRIENDAVIWPDQMGVLAMRKLAAGASPASGDWEWFVLATDGQSILDQGTNLGGGACNACHTGAAAAGGVGFSFSLQPQTAATSFASDVLPILQANCVSCHGGTNGLSLGTHAQVMNGGDSGAAVVPGNAGASLLFQKVDSNQMPPTGPLAAGEKATIAAWINEGALNN
jgi:hypothetical protein